VGLLAVGAWGLALRSAGANLPPLNASPSGESIPGKMVWADLFTSDPPLAARFYAGLFGWGETTVDRPGADGKTHTILIMTNEGRPIAGILLRPSRTSDQTHGRWVGFASVPDVAAALTTATSQGARVLFPAKDLQDRGMQAIFIDPDGAEFGLLHSSSGDPADYAADPGDWTWTELFARDPAKAGDFYRAVAGYEVVPDTRSPDAHALILVSGGYSRGSIAPVPNRPRARPHWLLFVRVGDVRAAAAKVRGIGGRVLLAPGVERTQYWKAVIADPTGGVLGLVQIDETGGNAATGGKGRP
jgi:predicted enzyme related to lactoylglutathione lyase